MASMLRFRADTGPPRARTGSPRHVDHPRHRRQRLRRQPPRPGLLAAGHRVVALVRTPDGRRDGHRAPAGRRARRRRDPDRRHHPPGHARRRRSTGVDAVVHLAAIPRDFSGGADLRLVNTEGTRARRRRDARGRRPPPRPHGRDGRRGRPGPALRELEGEGRGARPRIGPRLDDPQAVAPVRRGRRVLQHRRRARPALAGHRARAGRRPVAASSRSTAATSRPSSVRALADPTTSARRSSSAGRATGRIGRSPAEVLSALGKRRLIVPMPVPLIRLVAGTSELVRLPFPVATDQLRQLRLDNIGPLDLIPRGSASSRGRWRARSATSGRDGATRSRRGRAGRARMKDGLRRVAGAVVWLVVIVAIALGAAGIVTGMDHPPRRSRRAARRASSRSSPAMPRSSPVSMPPRPTSRP